MTFEHWQELYARSQEAILWVDRNVSVIEDWFPPLYSLIVCALIQVGSCLHPPFSFVPLGTIGRKTEKKLNVPSFLCSIIHLFGEENTRVSKHSSLQLRSSSEQHQKNVLSVRAYLNLRVCCIIQLLQSIRGPQRANNYIED